MMDAATQRRLRELFIGEAEDSLSAMEGLAARFRAADDLAAVDELGKVAHGLKGAAAAVGFTELVGALHQLEGLTLATSRVEVSQRGPSHQRLTRSLQLLQAIVAALSADGRVPPDVLATLQQTLSAAASAPAPAAREVAAPRPSAPGRASSDPALERLNLPAQEVDEALRLASAVARLASAIAERLTSGESSPLGRSAVELTHTSDRLEAILLHLRMVPAAGALVGLDLEVAELARQLGKEAALAVDDRDVRADRATLQTARGMIRHLLRNALDHGMELPAARALAGKPRQGTLRISMQMADSMLQVEVADDGAGFDLPAVRAQMESRQGKAAVAALSNAELLLQFAASGGSTRDTATEISGRGVGLSAVVSLARSKGGDFQLDTTAGRGSSIRFTLPLEIYTTEVLTLRCGARRLGLPMSSVERTLRLANDGQSVQQGPSGPILALDERIVHLRCLGTLVGEPESPDSRSRFAVVVRGESREVAFTVDELGETLRVIPQTAPPRVQADAIVTGIAMLADGTQLQILNPLLLLGLARDAAAPAEPREQAQPKRKLTVLLAEDSLATREVLRVLLEQEGYQVWVAGDGEEALERLRHALPDVVLTDFNMPRCDGPTLTRRLRATPRTARLPVVLLTSKDDPASMAEGAAAGADGYLVKSQFNASVLRAALRRLGIES